MEKQEKIKGYLNIAHKAGYLIIGGEKIKDYKKKLYLVIYDEKSLKNTIKIVEKVQNNGILTLKVENLSNLVGIDNCKIVGIKNKNISDLIVEITNKE